MINEVTLLSTAVVAGGIGMTMGFAILRRQIETLQDRLAASDKEQMRIKDKYLTVREASQMLEGIEDRFKDLEAKVADLDEQCEANKDQLKNMDDEDVSFVADVVIDVLKGNIETTDDPARIITAKIVQLREDEGPFEPRILTSEDSIINKLIDECCATNANGEFEDQATFKALIDNIRNNPGKVPNL